MADPAKPSISDVVSMSTRRPQRLRDEFDDLFVATYPQVVRTVWLVAKTGAWPKRSPKMLFTELYRGWSKLRTHDRPDPWVRRVAIRRAQRESTRRARRRVLEHTAGDVSLVEDGIRLPDPELVPAIRTLPPKQRAIVSGSGGLLGAAARR